MTCFARGLCAGVETRFLADFGTDLVTRWLKDSVACFPEGRPPPLDRLVAGIVNEMILCWVLVLMLQKCDVTTRKCTLCCREDKNADVPIEFVECLTGN